MMREILIMGPNQSICVAGATGMVGSAILRALIARGCTNILATHHRRRPARKAASHPAVSWISLDLCDDRAVAEFFQTRRPAYVFLAAARVGGIWANNAYRADFIHENLRIQDNVIHQSYSAGVKKLLFLGSSCIYPRECPQPMNESELLQGPLEYTNEPYAIAKIAGIKMCESYSIQYGCNFVSVMPTNLFGPHDNFDLETSHVLPALLRKVHLAKCLAEGQIRDVLKDLGVDDRDAAEAILKKIGVSSKQVAVWGSGAPMREFLYVDDLAEACLFVMDKVDFEDVVPKGPEIRNTHINVGTGREIAIRDLASLIREVVGFQGDFVFDQSKPDGTLRKCLNVSKLTSLGWTPRVGLTQGIEWVYQQYLAKGTE